MDNFIRECLLQMANAVERLHGSIVAIIGYTDGAAKHSLQSAKQEHNTPPHTASSGQEHGSPSPPQLEKANLSLPDENTSCEIDSER